MQLKCPRCGTEVNSMELCSKCMTQWTKIYCDTMLSSYKLVNSNIDKRFRDFVENKDESDTPD